MAFLWVIASGIVATSGLILFMDGIRRLTGIDVDMIRAIGTLWTRKRENAFWPGLLTHYFMGICFASLYLMLVGIAPVATPGAIIIVTLVTGWVHGVVVSLFYAAGLVERHPLKSYKRMGFHVMLAQTLGHVVFGGLLGISFLVLQRISYGEISSQFEPVLRPLSEATGYMVMWIPIFGVPLLFCIYVLWRTFKDTRDARLKMERTHHDKKNVA